jgi:hypothetical protein
MMLFGFASSTRRTSCSCTGGIQVAAIETFALQELVDAEEQDGHVGLLRSRHRFRVAGFGIVAFNDPAAARVQHLRVIPDLLLDAIERLDEGGVQPGVIRAGLREIGERPDDGDGLERRSVERQEVVSIGEQHD